MTDGVKRPRGRPKGSKTRRQFSSAELSAEWIRRKIEKGGKLPLDYAEDVVLGKLPLNEIQARVLLKMIDSVHGKDGNAGATAVQTESRGGIWQQVQRLSHSPEEGDGDEDEEQEDDGDGYVETGQIDDFARSVAIEGEAEAVPEQADTGGPPDLPPTSGGAQTSASGRGGRVVPITRRRREPPP